MGFASPVGASPPLGLGVIRRSRVFFAKRWPLVLPVSLAVERGPKTQIALAEGLQSVGYFPEHHQFAEGSPLTQRPRP